MTTGILKFPVGKTVVSLSARRIQYKASGYIQYKAGGYIQYKTYVVVGGALILNPSGFVDKKIVSNPSGSVDRFVVVIPG